MTHRRRHGGAHNGHEASKRARQKLPNPAPSVPKSPKPAPIIPPWEEISFRAVGSMPKKRLVEAEKYPGVVDRVAEWDNSAGEEALKNAMLRYWSNINGQPCKVPLPDPDMYSHKIDWNVKPAIDPVLLRELNEASGSMKSNGFDKPVKVQIKPSVCSL